jgi:hypothetical protein
MWFGELTFCLQFIAEYRRFIPSNNLWQVCILHWSFKEFRRHHFPDLCLVLCPNAWHKLCTSTHPHPYIHTALTNFLLECSEMICMRCQFDLLSVHLSHTYSVATVEVGPHFHHSMMLLANCCISRLTVNKDSFQIEYINNTQWIF